MYPDGFKIDVASARMEYYKFPAALPVVEMSSIKLDLYRRDFTINTLAIQLNPDRFGILIDFFNAQKDIKEKAIRVLHNLSFVEDPTRVFRAIRFEQRFGFAIGRLTAGLIQNAVRMDFFRRAFRPAGVQRAAADPAGGKPGGGRRAPERLRPAQGGAPRAGVRQGHAGAAQRGPAGRGLVRFAFPGRILYEVGRLFPGPDPPLRDGSRPRRSAGASSSTPGCRRSSWRAAPSAQECLARLARSLPVDNSTLYHRLAGFRTELILFMMAARRAGEGEEGHLALLHHTCAGRPSPSRGEDLKALGVRPGPIYREVLPGRPRRQAERARARRCEEELESRPELITGIAHRGCRLDARARPSALEPVRQGVDGHRMKKRLLSGMRPTGPLHLGNYHGALDNWVRLQEEYDCFFFVADWHALTSDYEKPDDIRGLHRPTSCSTG
ncbi:MAG: hypothetical protein MZV70_75850 [Desulfobacterales bacterium]|nr:hypothetical protein [Desulfobacterales bacterium]